MIYLFNPENYEYQMTIPDVDPVPDNGTVIEPPEYKEDTARVFNPEAQEWSEYPDYRCKYMMTDGKETKGIETYGEIPESWQLITFEEAKINALTMTALDFIGLLQSAGLTLAEIDTYLAANIELKTQLTYCQNVYCGVVRALCPITYGDVTITDEMIVQAFEEKNKTDDNTTDTAE